MRLIHKLTLPAMFAILIVFVSACATTTSSAPTSNANYKNILVIGVANDYESRAQFERKTVSELKAMGVSAAALYSVGGGNKPIDRVVIEALVKTNGYDAVLISRVLSREGTSNVTPGSTGAKATRRDGGAVDLFRYDYEELNEPSVVDTSMTVVISTELFAAATSQMVWSNESTISNKENLDKLINEASDTIIRRLKREKLIGS